jgi:hypothetical protein
MARPAGLEPATPRFEVLFFGHFQALAPTMFLLTSVNILLINNVFALTSLDMACLHVDRGFI